MDLDKPKFKHDCKDCKFLGTFNFKDIDYDLYFCEQGGMGRIPTVIGRFGDNGSYSSGLGLSLPELIEATRRAIARGYLKGA